MKLNQGKNYEEKHDDDDQWWPWSYNLHDRKTEKHNYWHTNAEVISIIVAELENSYTANANYYVPKYHEVP